MTQHTPISAILLAAGESTRMRQQKALLLWQGTTLIQYQVSSLLEAGVSQVVVVLGYRAERLRSLLEDTPGVQTVLNLRYRTGKSSSVRAGVRQVPLDASGVLVLSVDQPRSPELVRQVISLGSPFGDGRDTGSYPRRLFSLLNPEQEIGIDQNMLSVPPPVPSTAVYTRGDGVVNWRTSCQAGEHQLAENIEVWSSHCGLTFNPTVWFILAERLSQPHDDWRPFERGFWRRLFYPKGAHAELAG